MNACIRVSRAITKDVDKPQGGRGQLRVQLHSRAYFFLKTHDVHGDPIRGNENNSRAQLIPHSSICMQSYIRRDKLSDKYVCRAQWHLTVYIRTVSVLQLLTVMLMYGAAYAWARGEPYRGKPQADSSRSLKRLKPTYLMGPGAGLYIYLSN